MRCNTRAKLASVNRDRSTEVIDVTRVEVEATTPADKIVLR